MGRKIRKGFSRPPKRSHAPVSKIFKDKDISRAVSKVLKKGGYRIMRMPGKNRGSGIRRKAPAYRSRSVFT